MIALQSVYECFASRRLLYTLMQEREPHQNISHRAMPSWDQHCDFINSRPYLAWYVVLAMQHPVGACYLTKSREIGIGILKAYRGHGYGRGAIEELMRLHPGGRYLANIAPGNEASIALFSDLGFKGPIQITLEKS